MTAVYTRGLNQAATYWPPGANDGAGGISYGSPVAIRCRWQNVVELFRSSSGEELTSSAVVYVDTEVVDKGKLALGEFGGDPTGDAREIRGRASSPSMDATRQLLKVWL